MIMRILPAYYFSLESLYLYFLLFLFYTRIGEIPSIPSFLAITAAGCIVVYIGVKRKQVSGVFPFLGAILCGIIAYLFDYTPMSILLCAVFLFFRIGAFIKDPTLWREERPKLAIIFYCTGFLIYYIGWVFHFSHMNYLYGIVIVFSLLFVIGRFLQQVEGENSTRNVVNISSTIGIAVALTGIVMLIIPVAKWALMNVFQGLIMIVTFLLSPLFYFVQGLIFTPKPIDRPVDDPFDQAPVHKAEKALSNQHLLSDIPMWFWIVLFALVLFAIWLIVRKRKIESAELAETESIEIKRIPVQGTTGRKGRFFREPAPNEYIRKLFYQLHIFADKHHLGRYHHETMKEWFQRVGFTQNEELFLAYDHVRYGKEDIPKKDALHLEDVIKEIKRDIIGRKK